MKTLVALYGIPESGKDLVGEYMHSKYDFHKVSVGVHIRRELDRAVSLLHSGIFLPDSMLRLLSMAPSERQAHIYCKPTDELGRECLQWFGAFKRREALDYWLRQVKVDIDNAPTDRVVFTDMRAGNEYDYAHVRGTTVKIIRPQKTIGHDIDRIESGLNSRPFHYIIQNDSGIDDLFDRIDVMITRVLDGE